MFMNILAKGFRTGSKALMKKCCGRRILRGFRWNNRYFRRFCFLRCASFFPYPKDDQKGVDTQCRGPGPPGRNDIEAFKDIAGRSERQQIRKKCCRSYEKYLNAFYNLSFSLGKPIPHKP